MLGVAATYLGPCQPQPRRLRGRFTAWVGRRALACVEEPSLPTPQRELADEDGERLGAARAQMPSRWLRRSPAAGGLERGTFGPTATDGSKVLQVADRLADRLSAIVGVQRRPGRSPCPEPLSWTSAAGSLWIEEPEARCLGGCFDLWSERRACARWLTRGGRRSSRTGSVARRSVRCAAPRRVAVAPRARARRGRPGSRASSGEAPGEAALAELAQTAGDDRCCGPGAERLELVQRLAQCFAVARVGERECRFVAAAVLAPVAGRAGPVVGDLVGVRLPGVRRRLVE